MKKKIKETIIGKISTFPSANSLKWAGRQVSILSHVLLWTLWICRLFSLLQIFKFFFRTIARMLRIGTKDERSMRINVPPLFCELYFICWFVFLLYAYLTNLKTPIVIGLTWYFLFESTVWILYYTIFRRFFEENYSIYHDLEYLTVLVLLVPTQALAFANYYNDSFGNMIAGLLGASGDDSPIIIKIFGALFAAIVISMIISTFPTERVKKKIDHPKMFIIGCGNVVKNRLYPALLGSKCAKKDIFVYDLKSSTTRESYCQYVESEDRICKRIDGELDSHDIIWIETPPYAHVKYLKSFINSEAALIVVEKPVTIIQEDIDYIKRLVLDEEKRNKVFFLSYYLIEKALPIYMVSNYNPKYEKYLDIDDLYLIRNSKLLLGALTQVNIQLFEGKDLREWAFDDNFGGQLTETFLHNVILASLFAGVPSNWSKVDLTRQGKTSIKMTAQCNGTDIQLVLVKNNPIDKVYRYAQFKFANGSIHADFDHMTAVVYFRELHKECHISIKEKYANKYGVMVDLVKRVESGECAPFEVDGLTHQIEVIEWLLHL